MRSSLMVFFWIMKNQKHVHPLTHNTRCLIHFYQIVLVFAFESRSEGWIIICLFVGIACAVKSRQDLY
jgi:hypothetical protein